MKKLRYLVPVLGVAALISLFLLLPETRAIGCRPCAPSDPYIPLIGAGYFSMLIAISLLFPTLPGSWAARVGLIWSILLALAMTSMKWPGWCGLCLVGHACNILIWTIWVAIPAKRGEASLEYFRGRLSLVLFIPFSVIALFSSLNLTFMAYGFKAKQKVEERSLKEGDKVPSFSVKTSKGKLVAPVEAPNRMIINFIAPDCPYCEEQLELLKNLSAQIGSCRIINISRGLKEEWLDETQMEWVEDKEGSLRKLFKVSGYPMLFVLGHDGRIVQATAGVSEQLATLLMKCLVIE